MCGWAVLPSARGGSSPLVAGVECSSHFVSRHADNLTHGASAGQAQ
jgi:hypothetical protein